MGKKTQQKQVAAALRKGASKRNNHHSDLEDKGTVVSQVRQHRPFLAPLAITKIRPSTTFALVIKEICPYKENDQHLDGNTGRLMTDDALFVIQQTKLVN